MAVAPAVVLSPFAGSSCSTELTAKKKTDMKDTPTDPVDGQVKLTGFDRDKFLRNVNLDGLQVHAERLAQDQYFNERWREWFASLARLSKMLQEDGG